MGAGPSRLPKKEGFLVDQKEPATGFLLGDIASTSDGPVVLRFPCGMTLDTGSTIKPEPAAVCEVVDVDENPLFSIHRAGAEPRPSIFSTHQPLRKPTIVRDPDGMVIGVLGTDAKRPPSSEPTSYTGYSARPRFAGQVAAFTFEDVPLYPWFMSFNPTPSFHDTMIYLYGSKGLEQPHAYDHKIAVALLDPKPPWRFFMCHPQESYRGPLPRAAIDSAQLVQSLLASPRFTCLKSRGPAKKPMVGVAYGDVVGGNVDAGGRSEVTIAKGMDAGLVAMAAFCPALLEAEFQRGQNHYERL